MAKAHQAGSFVLVHAARAKGWVIGESLAQQAKEPLAAVRRSGTCDSCHTFKDSLLDRRAQVKREVGWVNMGPLPTAMNSFVPPAQTRPLPSAAILGSRINALSWRDTLVTLGDWAAKHQSRYVCISNVHMVVTAREDRELAEAMRQSDMATPDGAPIAWMLRRLGFANQPRISGTELMRAYLAQAAGRGESIFLLGSTEETLARLQQKLLMEFPALLVAGAVSPPFRSLSDKEDAAMVARINASGAGTVWLSLGCPKQEKWMLEHRGKINAVTLGVGAAFDFIAGTKPRAPAWMQAVGLEWLHRLASEPGRLWKRYLVTNGLFVLGAARQLLFGTRP